MPSVADYAVLQDGRFFLETGGTFNTQPFNRPSGFVQGTNLARAVLAFTIGALPKPPFAPSVDMTITHFGEESQEVFRTFQFNGGGPFGTWEAFPATNFLANGGNIFNFTVQSGRVVISDIILWYQLRV